jgi:predicted amidohydrolase
MSTKASFTIGTCGFPVDKDINRNFRYIIRQLRLAKARGADVAHFPECALSGYAGSDFESYDGFDWETLKSRTGEILDEARDLRLWVILGSTHRLTSPHKPHNSVYIIDDRGRIVDRYDKRFCAGDAAEKIGDLAHYSPGNHPAVFEVRGVKCGVLICHDYRYPELYREYKRLGVELVFHSYHAGHVSREQLRAGLKELGQPEGRDGRWTLPGVTMPASMIAAAASTHVWISASNTTARESCWASLVVRPDGIIAGQLRLNTSGVLVTKVDAKAPLYDSTLAWRDRAMRGVLHSGTLVDDARSSDRTTF